MTEISKAEDVVVGRVLNKPCYPSVAIIGVDSDGAGVTVKDTKVGLVVTRKTTVVELLQDGYKFERDETFHLSERMMRKHTAKFGRLEADPDYKGE